MNEIFATFRPPITIFLMALALTINFPFLDGNIPRAPSYGVYISQLIRLARVSSHVLGFNMRNRSLTAKRLKQGYRSHDHKLMHAYIVRYNGGKEAC